MNEVNFSLKWQSSSSRTILNTPTTRPAACLYLGCLHQISYSLRKHCSQYTLRVMTAVMLEVNLYLEISCLLACFTFLGIYHKLSVCVCVWFCARFPKSSLRFWFQCKFLSIFEIYFPSGLGLFLCFGEVSSPQLLDT